MTENLREFLGYSEDSMPYILERGDGTFVAIVKFLFTHAVIVGNCDDKRTITDRWCYKSAVEALVAIGDWSARNYEGEPDGWHRHPYTGRRQEHL
jgi:hypothetical protein